MVNSKLNFLVGLIISVFIIPAIIINSLQFLGFAVVWTVWSHLFVYLDVLILYTVTGGAAKVAMHKLVAQYMKITQEALRNGK